MSSPEVWFITGSQDLYGESTLAQVASDAQAIASELASDPRFAAKIIWKPTVRSGDEIHAICRDANASESCIGLVTWMHTFSPAKMWIRGLSILNKPFVHLHTQYNRDIPWGEIDMDFMNLNQSAHGGREFGFVCTRMRKSRWVITGHWQDENVRDELASWVRAAIGVRESKELRVARFGDNMREVAVTEGNKVSAQMQWGYSVNGYGVGDLVRVVDAVGESEVEGRVARYRDDYEIAADDGDTLASIREQARIEVGMETFLEAGRFGAFTTTFEDLNGLKQLPGVAVQRLMAGGYGFGAEGDWKTAAMLRIMKVMGSGLSGGSSFMEDYTYHLTPGGMQVLGAHMLEVCPSIAAGRPSLEVHELGIGGKAAPARLVFNVAAGEAINVSPIDLGDRFRILVNEVDAVQPLHDLPKLPVARALWVPRPDLKTAATAWILAGGAHHTVYSQSIDTLTMEIFAEMMGIEMVVIDADTRLRSFRELMRQHESSWGHSR